VKRRKAVVFDDESGVIAGPGPNNFGIRRSRILIREKRP